MGNAYLPERCSRRKVARAVEAPVVFRRISQVVVQRLRANEISFAPVAVSIVVVVRRVFAGQVLTSIGLR